MHHAMVLRSNLYKSTKTLAHLPKITSPLTVPCRGVETNADMSDYPSKGGVDLLFHHQHLARAMKPMQKLKVIPKKKFEPEVYYSLEERFKGMSFDTFQFSYFFLLIR